MRRRTSEWAFTAVAIVALGVSGPSTRHDAQPMNARHAPPTQPATSAPHVPPTQPTARAPAVPFGVGEEMVYKLSAKWTLFRGGGSGSLKVEAIDTVRGFPTYRLVMRMKGGIAFYHIDDVHRSWLDVEGLFARRFEQVLSQTTYDRDRTYEFLLDEGRYVDLGNPSDSGVLASRSPLDDVSFVYHLRTMPLVVGEEYTEPRYYKDDGNPVTIRVLRKERIKVPAGEFDAIVIEPIIRREKSLFKEGEGEIWLSNDDRRLILKLRGKSFATMTMELQSFTPAAAAPTPR